jgi:hypothetical protein
VRRLTILLLLAAFLSPLAACGDDSDSAGQADETTTTEAKADDDVDGFAKALSESSNGAVSETDARCVGEQALPDLSKAGRTALATEDSDGPEALSEDDREVLYAAFDECIETADLAAAMAKEMGDGTDGMFGDDTLDCVVGELTSAYPKSGALMKALLSDDSEAILGETLTGCVSPADMEQQLVDEFRSEGFTDAQARCVAAKVSAAIPPEQLIALGESDGEIPADMQQTITEATTACLAAG